MDEMGEPNWEDMERRMHALTLRQLKPVVRWFSGCLGECTTKAKKISEMVSQMQHWWHRIDGGRKRVRNVLAELEAVETEAGNAEAQ